MVNLLISLILCAYANTEINKCNILMRIIVIMMVIKTINIYYSGIRTDFCYYCKIL